MKQFALMMIFIAATATGCSDKDDSSIATPPNAMWESYSHAQLLKLSGDVRLVTRRYSGEEDSTNALTAQFDAKGNCTAYNPTGIEIDEALVRKNRDNWGVEAVWYTYTYDDTGRMNSVTKYEVGSKPIIYSITYGTHNNYIPAPFTLGDIEPLLLKGVARIEAPGYLLTADSSTAIATQIFEGWRPAIEKTTFAWCDNLPQKQTVVTRSKDTNEELKRTETIYTYDCRWLVLIEEITSYPGDGSENQRLITRLSRQWPYTIIAKEGFAGTQPAPEFRIEYKYAENGLALSATYTTGAFYYGEFTQHYTAYDTAGNWISGKRRENGVEMEMTQTLTYY